MKIAVIGSHRTGKTTLSASLAEEFGFNLIPDVSHMAHKVGFVINEETPVETQIWILSKQIELERNTKESWISEKALWDNYIYGKYSISDKNAVNLIKKVSILNGNYDLVLYCPIEFPIADDGIRSLNAEFQKEIDLSYRSFLKKNGINYLVMSGDKNERLKRSKQHITSHLK